MSSFCIGVPVLSYRDLLLGPSGLVILSVAKNLSPGRGGEMFRGVNPERSRRAQHLTLKPLFG